MPPVSPPAVTAKARLRRIAQAVRAERLKRGLSVTKFAALIGCSFQMLYHIEAADYFPSMERYLVMCEKLGQPQPPLT